MSSAFREAIQLILSGNSTLFEIIGVTMRMSLASSLLALLMGVPLGALLGCSKFPGKKAIVILTRTMIGLPPVVSGLLCYLMFCGVGPLRHLHLLYTVNGMIIAQVILITPIVIGLLESFSAGVYPALRDSARGMGFRKGKTVLLLMNECRYSILTTYLLALARALAEVGAVSMVGGAIVHKTNIMTTAIMAYTNMGQFQNGMALGIVLILLALVLTTVVSLLQKEIPQ